jgi:hypothetical protein
MSRIEKPPFGTLNITEETSYEKITFDAGNIAPYLSDTGVYEEVTYNSGNVATNISDEASME